MPYAVAVQGDDGLMVRIVEKDTPLPVTRSVELVVDDADRPITLYAGDCELASGNAVAGQLTLGRPDRRGADRGTPVRVVVTVTVDAAGNGTAGCECRTDGDGSPDEATRTDYDCRHAVAGAGAEHGATARDTRVKEF